MYLEDYRLFCMKMKGTSESLPFDDKTLVFKVMNKMFALTNIENFSNVNLKCDPEKAIELRENHDFIKPAFHMNKKHWNSHDEPGIMEEKMLKELTIHSYNLVVSKMTKKDKLALQEL